MTDQPFSLWYVLQSGAEVYAVGFKLVYDFFVDEENRQVDTAVILIDPEGYREYYDATEEGATRAWKRMAKLATVSELP